MGRIISNCNGNTITGSRKYIAEQYKKLASQAKDETEKQNYLQHAEHYIRTITQKS